MPIFEYKCLKCGKLFEHLVIPASKDEKPQCPKCKATGKSLEQAISRFAMKDDAVTERHQKWVRKESDKLRHDRVATEERIWKDENT